ncbi:MAG: hypothetical protein WDM76_06620 [Limisphaerales bacterium]
MAYDSLCVAVVSYFTTLLPRGIIFGGRVVGTFTNHAAHVGGLSHSCLDFRTTDCRKFCELSGADTGVATFGLARRSGGLARFDGASFTTFNPQSTPELKDVEIETLSVDSRGTMWITAGNEFHRQL